MNVTIIYPDQLYKVNPSISKLRKIFLLEDFDINSIKPHKQKILLHLISMKKYSDYLKLLGHEVELIDYKYTLNRNFIKNFIIKNSIKSIHLCYLNNNSKEEILNEVTLKIGCKIFWYDSPNFLLNRNEILDKFSKSKKIRMSSFYIEQRKKFNVLIDQNNKPIGKKWSLDKLNRKSIPKNLVLPKIKKIYNNNDLQPFKLIIENKFINNIGEVDSFNYPSTFEQANESFDDFLKSRFYLFGDYEDAISNQNNYLFHSILSPYLNIGLITPTEIIDKTLYFLKHNNIPINSSEGFIRQIIGWREFIRVIYLIHGEKEKKSNFWNFTNSISESFYSANTGLYPFDHIVKNAKENGYSHHIERLMVIGNLMVLCKTKPYDVYKWFMEMYVDAYEWVMVPNVFGMSQFSDGGIFSTKPYISGSNYILKMSNFKSGKWTTIWDSLFWSFINDNRLFFNKNPRMKMMVSLYDKKDNSLKKKYNLHSKLFFEKL